MTILKKRPRGKVNDIDCQISSKLKTRRIVLGLTQKELGKSINVSVQQIQKYEKAINRISSGQLYKFANILKVPVNYFFEKIDVNNEGGGVTLDQNFEANEKEILILVKVFNQIKNIDTKKKIIELVKTIK